MRAMILAAGRGERMGALTQATPKPLLKVKQHYLIDYAIYALKRAGINDIVINVSYHKEQIKSALGDGSRYGVNLIYSEETERLETGGGIFNALPLLGKDPFIVMSCDIITDYALKNLPQTLTGLAHLVLVKNPHFHPEGDFGLHANGQIDLLAKPSLTFANIGLYHPALFVSCKAGHFRLNTCLFPAINQGLVTGELYQGTWFNVGTPDDLAAVNAAYQASKM